MSELNKYCCHTCFNKSGQMLLDRTILCPDCGNKRCAKATHHDLPCTGSNEPGQAGSIYSSPLDQVEELQRLRAIEEAAKNLVKVKGRYHTEQAFNKLKDLLS